MNDREFAVLNEPRMARLMPIPDHAVPDYTEPSGVLAMVPAKPGFWAYGFDSKEPKKQLSNWMASSDKSIVSVQSAHAPEAWVPYEANERPYWQSILEAVDAVSEDDWNAPAVP